VERRLFSVRESQLSDRAALAESEAEAAVRAARYDAKEEVTAVKAEAAANAAAAQSALARDEEARAQHDLRVGGKAAHKHRHQASLIASSALILQGRKVAQAANTAAIISKREANSRAAAVVRGNWQRRAAFEKHTRCLVASWTLSRTQYVNAQQEFAASAHSQKTAEQLAALSHEAASRLDAAVAQGKSRIDELLAELNKTNS